MVLEVSSVNFPQRPSSLSFSGSGFLATYQLGVAQCFLRNAPWLVQTAPSILGASAGSLVAACVACQLNLVTMRNEMLYFAKKMKGFALGPFSPSVNLLHWLRYVLNKHLPSDAHLLASGRLAVALTRLDNGEHTIITEYHSKDDVIQALLCSCFVPGYCGMLPPSFNGVYYMDGGFSGMQPVLSLPDRTLTVSPFSGETDICPADTPCMWDMVVTGLTLKGNVANGLRFFNALYPLKVATVEQAYHSGYKDAIHFLLSNQFVSNNTMKRISQEVGNYSRTETSALPEEEEEEEDVDEEVETTTKMTLTEPSLTFDTLKNGLLGDVMSYRSMLELPAGYLTYFLLTIMLVSQALIATQKRVQLLFRQIPDLVLWTWYSLRQFGVFFFGILFGTFKKNVKDTVLPFMLVLQLVRQQSEDEVPHKQIDQTAYKEPSCRVHSDSVKCGSLRSHTPLRGL